MKYTLSTKSKRIDISDKITNGIDSTISALSVAADRGKLTRNITFHSESYNLNEANGVIVSSESEQELYLYGEIIDKTEMENFTELTLDLKLRDKIS